MQGKPKLGILKKPGPFFQVHSTKVLTQIFISRAFAGSSGVGPPNRTTEMRNHCIYENDPYNRSFYLILTHIVGYFHIMQKRILTEILRNSIEKNKKSILLLGPRQVGKSTLIQNLEPDLKVNLSEERIYRDHLKDPDLIRRQVLALK